MAVLPNAGADALLMTPTPLADWLVVAPAVLPLLVGAFLIIVRKRLHWQAPVAITTLALVSLASIALLARVWSEGTLVMTMGRWLPPFGISFTVDLLGALFAVANSLIALGCAISASRRVIRSSRRYGYFAFLVLTAAGVNGTFTTGDIFNMYVWFEVFLISSFGLLVVGSTRAQLDGTMKYGVLNLIGTTLFLIATGLLYGIVGTLNMADIMRKLPLIEAAPLMTLATLYLLAFGMKAAAFPVHAWLPASYHTPENATSAYFGGVLTKVGVYALFRVLVMMFPVQLLELQTVVAWVAGSTMMLGALGALAQNDLRRMVGFQVILGVGVMMAGLAIGSAPGLAGGIFYALHSMVAISAAYLLVGVIERRSGSASLNALGGLWKDVPLLGAIAFVLVLSLGGLPPGSGLWPKVMLVQAALEAGRGWLTAAVLVSSLLSVIALGRFFLLTFWRPSSTESRSKHDGTPRVLGVLTVVAIVMGLYPEPFVAAAVRASDGLLDPAAYINAVFGEQG